MFCIKCGAENPDNAKFCQECGQEIPQEESLDTEIREETETQAQEQPGENGENGNVRRLQVRKRPLLIGGAIALIAVIICITAIVVYNGQKSNRYSGKMEIADKYLQEMEYKKAETAYLEAIKIDPKKEEPYIQLADLYLKQGKQQKALEILEQGEKKTFGKKVKKKLASMKSTASSGECGTYLDETLIPKQGLADVGVFTDDGDPKQGIVSAWSGDVDNDDTDEMVTTASESHHITDMRITLYGLKDGSTIQRDELVPEALEHVSDDYVSYGDSTTEVFIKKHDGSCYLVVYAIEAAQGYGSISEKVEVYTIHEMLEKCVTMESSWYRGSSRLTIDGKCVFEVTDEEFAEGADFSKTQWEDIVNPGVLTAQKTLKPYGLEDKATLPQEDGLVTNVHLKGYEPDEKSEIGLSKKERIQNGEYDSENEHPVMEVRIEDFTGIRDQQSSDRDSTDSAIKPGKLVQCLGEKKSIIEETFGQLSNSGEYWNGGDGFSFKEGYENVKVYFPVVSDVPKAEDRCTAITGPASQILDGIGNSIISIKDFESRCEISLDPGEESENDYYGEFGDGTRLVLYEIKDGVTGESIVTLLPASDSI